EGVGDFALRRQVEDPVRAALPDRPQGNTLVDDAPPEQGHTVPRPGRPPREPEDLVAGLAKRPRQVGADERVDARDERSHENQSSRTVRPVAEAEYAALTISIARRPSRALPIGSPRVATARTNSCHSPFQEVSPPRYSNVSWENGPVGSKRLTTSFSTP